MSKITRPSKDEYYLNIALEVSRRGTCLRRCFGAIIVNHDEIISSGYCGAPRGTPNCIDLGICYREEAGIPSGLRYELCRSVHAEMNAIISAERLRILDGQIYIAGRETKTNKLAEAHPCKMCQRAIINAGLKKVIIRTANGSIKEILVEELIKNN